ncbi:MAG: pyridoxal phosphate-dependent aminotransferase [SAR324 cluster bacterium]|nr:pyridoxal phosphate-dependent aminotransferase [SAR324 cluster bacterium]
MSISENMKLSMQKSSWIREMFEQGQRLKQVHGEDQVFDFSLGNPIVEPPPQVYEVLLRLLKEDPQGAHRYMPNAGFASTRDSIAEELRHETGLAFTAADVTMCVGAGGGLNSLFKALLDPGEEVLVMAPYFVEYGAYAQNHGGVLTVADTDESFQLDLEQIEQKLTGRTKIVMINSPNNPTGAVYSQELLEALGKLLAEKEKEFGHPIFLVSDDPYRYLIFDDLVPGNIFRSHLNSVMVTSHSKDLALPGERIGFIAIHPEMEDRTDLQNALALSTRILGFVNAPALMQRILPHLKGVRIPSESYQHLRDIFYDGLSRMGFEICKPKGTFYIFPKSPIPDDVEFVKQALAENILLVPGSGFGGPGYFRIAFCCTEDLILRSFPRFENLARKFGLVG